MEIGHLPKKNSDNDGEDDPGSRKRWRQRSR